MAMNTLMRIELAQGSEFSLTPLGNETGNENDVFDLGTFGIEFRIEEECPEHGNLIN